MKMTVLYFSKLDWRMDSNLYLIRVQIIFQYAGFTVFILGYLSIKLLDFGNRVIIFIILLRINGHL